VRIKQVFSTVLSIAMSDFQQLPSGNLTARNGQSPFLSAENHQTEWAIYTSSQNHKKIPEGIPAAIS
jgi:hypothetical protein